MKKTGGWTLIIKHKDCGPNKIIEDEKNKTVIVEWAFENPKADVNAINKYGDKIDKIISDLSGLKNKDLLKKILKKREGIIRKWD